MHRLRQTIQLDFTLQARNYYYHISLFTIALLSAILIYLFTPDQLAYAIPLLYLFGLGGTTYLFAAALILFEKQENCLEMLIVTPLRTEEYIWSKMITLTILGLFESVGIALVAYGGSFNWFFLVVGIVLMALTFVLLGIVVVVRYDTIYQFLMPTLLITLFLELPALHLLGFWETPVFYLIPTYPALLLMYQAFSAEWLSLLELIYGFVGSGLFIALLYEWSKRAFKQHIVEKR